MENLLIFKELTQKEKQIAELHVLIDTLQTNLRAASSYLTKEQKKEINTPSYRWCTAWTPANNFEI
tara:strand:- start:889 stop:1086 length:198 start_codon:yes stop_codon:yes gene_type:complete